MIENDTLDKPTVSWALRRVLKKGYHFDSFMADLWAGIVVGIVAVPLAMALAIASGVAPQYGLYTAVIAGIFCALLGGSKHQVSGPTAAFVVLLVPIVYRFGIDGLFLTCFISGIILIILGVARLGRAIRYIPHPVTTGFTAGIAVVIATLQIKDFLGLEVPSTSSHFLKGLYLIINALPTITFGDTFLGLLTLAILIFIVKKYKKIPAPVVAVTVVTLFSVLLNYFFPEFKFMTIGDRFPEGIPRGLPSPTLSWISSPFEIKFWKMIINVMPSALTVAALAAIESLLSAAVASGMTKKPFNPNSELIGLGVANTIGPFFGGIPATGAIARTSTNIRFGARSPIAAFIHGIFIVGVLLFLAPYATYLPMASLAALLLFVAYNMAERHHFLNILKKGTSEDKWVLLICFSFTVIFDMTVGVGVGLVLACLLFIKRMAKMTYGKTIKLEHTYGNENISVIPNDVFVFEVSGAMFFGTAQRAISALNQIPHEINTVVIDMHKLHAIDTTGLVALQSALEPMIETKKKIRIVLDNQHLKNDIEKYFKGTHLLDKIKWLDSFNDFIREINFKSEIVETVVKEEVLQKNF